ncbi:hypothetical protein GCM10022397_12060 [Flavivirga jejuensis]
MGETYYIQSAIAGKYLDVQNNQTANGTPLHLWRYNGGNAQKFTLEDAGGGYFHIKFRLGKYLHVQHGSNQPRVLAHLWEGKSNDNSKWRFITAPNGYFYIQSKKGTYLDVKGGQSADGTPIWMYVLNKGNAQRWKLKKASYTQSSNGASTAVVVSGSNVNKNVKVGKTYYIQSAIGAKYMDVKMAGTANGTPIHLWRYNGGNAQKFIFENAGSGYFYIKSVLGKYLHVQGASNQPRVLAHLWTGKGGDQTKWQFIKAPNGYHYIRSKKGTYLDVKGGVSTDGTPIWMYPLNRGNAQRWKLNEVPAATGTSVIKTPLLLNSSTMYSYLANVATISPANIKKKSPKGPDFEEGAKAVFSNLDGELTNRFRHYVTSKFSRLDANLIPDKEPNSGVFYYVPNSYHLSWDSDLDKHKLRINYSRNTDGRADKSTRVSATLSSGIMVSEIKFMENMLDEMRKNTPFKNIPIELRPLPVESPRIEFQGGGFDINGDQITIVAFSDFGEDIEMSFTTSDDNIDAMKNGELQNKMSFILHFNSSVDNEQTYDIPADISIKDEQSYGIFDVELPTLQNVKNLAPFPIIVKYLHVLTAKGENSEIIPYIYSFELGDKTIQPNDILKFNKPSGFRLPAKDKPLRAFVEYRLLPCEPCTQKIINGLTGGITSATKQEVKFKTINLLRSTGAETVLIYMKSHQLDPGKQREVETYEPIEINEDGSEAKSPKFYLLNGEQPDFKYKVGLMMEDGKLYESNTWIRGDKLKVFLTEINLKSHFDTWPKAEEMESENENDDDN